jgi:hypothetical protein
MEEDFSLNQTINLPSNIVGRGQESAANKFDYIQSKFSP